MSRNKHKKNKFVHVPSNTEVAQITENSRYSREVANGLLALHKQELELKTTVMELIDKIYQSCNSEIGADILNDYRIVKVEIIAPQFIDVDVSQLNQFIHDTIDEFLLGCKPEQLDNGKIYQDDGELKPFKEAILVQVKFASKIDDGYFYMRAGQLLSGETGERIVFACDTDTY